MRIGVFSDVHDHLDNLERALGRFEEGGMRTLLFLGDFCSPIPARRIGTYRGEVHCVFGNGDGDRFAILKLASEPGSALRLHGEHAEVEIAGRALALTHYPLYGRALARTGDYAAVFSGHTHEAHVERFGDCLWVNPGDLLGLKGAPSVAVYDTDTGTAEILPL